MKEEDKSKLIEVFKGSLWEAQLVKSLLGNNDIESTLKDGMVVNVVLPDTAIDVAVLVMKQTTKQPWRLFVHTKKRKREIKLPT